MTSRRLISLIAGASAITLSAAALAACGGGGSSSATVPTTPSGRAATLGVDDNNDLGNILVDSRARTLYLFQKDSNGKSSCFGACASQWPPLRVTGMPALGSGLTASRVGTIRRSDGKPQVIYNGHPLYRFEGDQSAGQTNGQGINAFGANWFGVTPAGSAASGTGSNSGGTPGY